MSKLKEVAVALGPDKIAEMNLAPKPKRPPGRPKGKRNRATEERESLALHILRSKDSPLMIMWEMATGKRVFDENILEAAKAAAPYVHPKLQNVTVDGNIGILTHEDMLEMLDDAEDVEYEVLEDSTHV